MKIHERNLVFEEYQNIINWTVNRHRSLLKTLRMETEDLKQELALCLLGAIESYDPARGAKPSTYYIKKLRYGVLTLWREQLREKRVANLNMIPLVCYDRDGEEITLELPFEVDYDMELRINEFMDTLSKNEREALTRVVNGEDPDDRRHKRFMAIVKRKALRYRMAGGGF